MNLIIIKLSGVRSCFFFHVRGYIDKEEKHENVIRADYYLFGKILIWRKPVFKEDVPMYSVIQSSCFGYTNWNSSRPYLIRAAIENRIIKKIKL